jgi:hypothetical protein
VSFRFDEHDFARLDALARQTQKTWHPGTWRHFMATRAVVRDTRAVRLVQKRERERDRSSDEREL